MGNWRSEKADAQRLNSPSSARFCASGLNDGFGGWLNGVKMVHKLKRDRRTKARIEQLDSQIIEALKASAPQSVLHLFYRMTDPSLPEYVENSWRGYRHVQDRCVKLRRVGMVPTEWIAEMIDNHTARLPFSHCTRRAWEQKTPNA